ncbi:MAG: hypothetical protein ACC726_01795 [Chloroflexota bacterium]
MRTLRTATAIPLALLMGSIGTATLAQDAPMSEGIVSAVIKAPIVADGDVAGALTDFVIIFDTDLDPAVPGRTLAAGNTIRVTLPDDFVSTGLPAATPPACDGPCNTGVLLQGWPQRPFPPIPEFYTLEMDGTHSLVYTAVQDLAPGATPGIKQVHLILDGFVNPGPGDYAIEVEAQTGSDGAVETGTGILTILPAIRPSINVTSVFAKATQDDPAGNSIYQEAEAGGLPPFAWDFLLWDGSGAAAVGVELRQNDDAGGEIVQGDAVIGTYTIAAPDGATGQSVSGGPSVEIDSPVSGVPTGRLTATFTAGDAAGQYVTTFEMEGGNAQQMFVTVPG